MNKRNKTTHFGFESVDWNEKEKKVGAVFQSVAHKYDVMNNIMSLGVHHLWKKFAVELAQVKPGQIILDLAGGSGDLSKLFSKKTGSTGQIFLTDINEAMLNVGRDRLLNEGISKNIKFIQGNAQTLPFADNLFDCIIMAFGLRNVTDKAAALQSMHRTCKPGGKLLILEFSKPELPGLKPLYDWYSFKVLPKLGKMFADDPASYQYLAESIRMHPDQNELKEMIVKAGFEDSHYHNLSGGIVALHMAYKY